MESSNCVTCEAELSGPFCAQCGEKAVTHKDFKLKNLSEQGLDIFTHLDSKLFKTLKGLLFKPGLLTTEFIRGKRKPYMKPFQVFFLCNVLFFIFLSSFDIFLIPSKWFFNGGYYDQMQITSIAKAIAAERNISLETLALIYDAKVTSWSKLLVISITPFLALGSLLFGFRQHREYGKHFIFALYLLSFFIVFSVIWARLMMVMPFQATSLIFNTGFLIVFFTYTYFALKRFIHQSVWLRILNTTAITALLIALVLGYRMGVSLFTLMFLV